MNVPVTVQVGMRGSVSTLAPVWLDVPTVGATSTWAGSYHVLAMGRHFDHYAITRHLPNLPPIPGFPTAHPYMRLTGKIRAAGVTGNIGEAIAAIFARRYLNARIRDIAHIRPNQPFRRRKAPDYMMRIGAALPGVFSVDPPNVLTDGPTWWPVESKARNTAASAEKGRRDALRQLFAYWNLVATGQPTAVGYGMIVTFVYHDPREVRATLLLPRDQAALLTSLPQNVDDVSAYDLPECFYGF